MAAFNFPNSPSTNDTHTENSVTWKWNGTVWKRQGVAGAQGAAGAQGHQGVQGAANATTINNNANNKVITGSGSANTLEAEASLTFDAGLLKIDDTGGTAGKGRLEFGNSGEQFIEGFDTGNAGSGSYLRFGDGSTERLRIDSSGNIGVGVNNPSSFNSDGRNLVVGTGSGGQGISIYSANNNYGSIYFADGTSGSELYRGAVLYNHNGDYLRLDTAGGERARITSTGGISLKNGFLQENWYNAGSAWSTDGEVNLDNGMVQYNSNNLAGTNNTIDLVTTAGIKTDMVNGSICAVTLITAVSASTAYINHVTIDQIAQTESWIGGSAPTAGGSSGFDTYTFNIMRWGTGNTDFTIIANHVKTS